MNKLLALAGLLWIGTSSLPAAAPLVFPKPRQIEVSTERLKLREDVPILLPSAPTADDLFLARFLAAELGDRYGLALHTKTVSALPADGAFILVGSAANPLMRQYVSGYAQPPAESEGYVLEVNAKAAVVAGTDASGAFYGLQSLRQLIERGPDGLNIHGVRIRDWPLLPFRGVKLLPAGTRKHFVLQTFRARCDGAVQVQQADSRNECRHALRPPPGIERGLDRIR